MDTETLQEIKESLLRRWNAVRKQTQRENEASSLSVSEGSVPQTEIIDIAQTLEQIGRDTSLAEQERRELHAIERALAKMASGNFGTCEDCGEEIPAKRLVVLPEARLCANCQAYEEKQSSRLRSQRASAR